MTTSDYVDIASSTVLIAVTTAYVVATFRILGEARREATAAVDASSVAHATLEELRRQRLLSVAPYLLAQSIGLTWYGERLVSLDITVRNVGPGPAFYPSAVLINLGGTTCSEQRVGSRPITAGGEAELELRPSGDLQGGRTLVILLESADMYGARHGWRQSASVLAGRPAPLRITAPERDDAPVS
jgi:hypothetical protein